MYESVNVSLTHIDTHATCDRDLKVVFFCQKFLRKYAKGAKVNTRT